MDVESIRILLELQGKKLQHSRGTLVNQDVGRGRGVAGLHVLLFEVCVLGLEV